MHGLRRTVWIICFPADALASTPARRERLHSCIRLCYTYFANGALKTASTTYGGTWTYGYNKRRLSTSESLALGGRTFAPGTGYTGLGDVSTLTSPSGLSLSFAPNALGQPRQAGTYASTATYHPNGSLAGFTYGNGLTHSGSLNARGLPLRVRDTFGASARLDYQYAYDKHGNPTQVTARAENPVQQKSRQWNCRLFCILAGAPGEIRTPDPQVRSLVLYPAELRARKKRNYVVKHAICQELSDRISGGGVRGIRTLDGAFDPILP